MATTTGSKRLLNISADAMASSNSITLSGLDVATQSWVTSQISNLVASAPTTLDTLNELAAALGDDPNFATTVSTSIGNKLDKTHDMTLTLSGDATGSTTFTDMGNATLTVTVVNDSHTHDGRYYTETEVNNLLAGKLSTTGKAADSNKLDGLDSTAFLRSNANDTATGVITFNAGINTLSINDTSGQQLVICAGEAGIDASQTGELVYVNAENGFQVAASNDNWATGYAGTKKTIIDYGGIRYDGNYVWHSGNFNPSSYLTTSGKAADSDKLDGLDLGGTRANVANKVVRTDANGYTNFGWINTTSGNTTGTITDFYVNTNDGYIRKATKAHVKSQLGLGSAAYVATSTFAPAAHTHDWGSITDKPATFAPSAHTHLAADITDAGDIFVKGIINVTVSNDTLTFTANNGATFDRSISDANTWRPIDDVPVNGATTESISSNWAYDHANASNPHGITLASLGYTGATNANKYVHPTHAGDDINIDTGALTGATVISDLDFNVTTDSLGHVTDANATISTRNLTAGDIGAATASHNHTSLNLTGSIYNGSANYSIDLRDHSDGTWLRNQVGRWTFQSGTSGDDWTQSYTLYLPAAGSTANNVWAELGQRDSNDASAGRYRGLRVVKDTGSVADGDLRAGAIYVGTTRKDLNWDSAYNNYITGVSVTGTTTKTLTLTQRDGGTITTTFSDYNTNSWRPIDDTPVNGVTDQSISSNWAYDHVNASNPHGTTAADVGAAPASHTHNYISDSYLAGQQINDANLADTRGAKVNYLSAGAANSPSGTDHSLFTLSYSNAWSTQLAGDWRTKQLYFRTQENGTWKSWSKIYHADNLTLATLGYTGATNANYITNNNQLTNGAGYAVASTLGSLALEDTVAISEVVGLTTALGNKLEVTGKAADSEKLDGIDSSGFLRSNANDTLSSTLKVTGSLIYENNSSSGYIPFPKGAMYQTTASTVTGAIKIKLPTHGTADMMTFVVEIYDYSTNESLTVFIAGYLYQATNSNEWNNCTVRILANQTGKDYTVRFGADGSNNCVWIGETNTTWGYPQVMVRDFFAAFSTDIDAYNDNWGISFVTSFDTVDETRSDNLPAADWDRIEGKPTSFTPSSHTHVAADITDAGDIFSKGIIDVSVSNDTFTFTKNDGGTFTRAISDANTNYYLNGISRSGNVLTFSVNGTTNQTYTFGSAAWAATTDFLGAAAKAADSNLLDGLDSSAFIRSNADDNVSGNTEWQDNKQIRLGNGADLRIWHDGNNHYFRSYNHGANYYFQGEDNEGTNHNMLILQAETSRPYVRLYENGAERLKTTSTGVTVTGTVTASTFSGSLDWNNVTSKPSTFTPAAHTHVAADITDAGDIFLKGIIDVSVSNDTFTFTKNDGGTFTRSISDANTNYYLNGITKSGNTLTFAVSGATNQTYTFGSNAFTSYTNHVGLYDSAGSAAAVESALNTRIEQEVLPSIPTVPTNVSAFTNDAGYITDGNTNWNNSYGFITNSVTDFYVADQILHTGDTNTYIQFHAADQWRVVTGGGERLEVNNSAVTVQNQLNVNGSVRFSTITSGILLANASGDISATSASSLVQDNIYSPKGWKLTGSTYTAGNQNITSSTTVTHSGTTPVTRTNNTTFTINQTGHYEIRYQFTAKNNYANRCVVGAQVTDSGNNTLLGSRNFDYLRYTTYGEYASIQATFYVDLDANATVFLKTAIRSGSLNYTLDSETGANAGHISFRLIKEL
jgi:hypothetical protein